MDGRWKVGELARLTGLTVRTLHHYDQVGLLIPSGRTPSGHRLYDDGDVRRLYQVLPLRELGLPLDVIAGALDGAPTLPQLLMEHLDHVEARLRAVRGLRDRLTGLVRAVQQAEPGADPTSTALLDLIEEMTTMGRAFEKYYTAEQRDQLARRREQLGEKDIAGVEAEWPELIAAVQAEHDAGTDPGDPRVQALAARWMQLVELFHGGDPGLRDSLSRMYDENAEQMQRQGGPSPELIDYVRRARAATS